MKKILSYSILAMFVAIFGFIALTSLHSSKASANEDNNGWSTCVSTGPQCGTDNGTQTKTVYTDPISSCPDGYTFNWSENSNQQCKKVIVTTTNPTFSCSFGYHYQNDGDFNQRCHANNNDTRPEHKAPTISCPFGYTESGNDENATCSKITTIYSGKIFSCPEGYTSKGEGDDLSCSKVINQSCHTGIIDNNACEVSPSPTPTATPSATPTPEQNNNDGGNPPTFAGSSTEAPVCGDGTTTQLPANPFVIRQGDKATVNFFITEGNQANIYYKVLGQSDWQYSVIGVKPNGDNFVSYTIQGLDPQLGYDFGVQQVQGCGGGQLVTAVIVDGASYNPVLFKFSYWEWSK